MRTDLRSYHGKRVTIMGLGLFGGGVGAARFFAERGATVIATDTRSETDLASSVEALRAFPNISFALGRHEPDHFRQADIVVANPGVAPESPYLAMAREAGARIEREINLLFKLTPNNPKVGITGSNGKSTTTAMAGRMLQFADPRVLIGGNLGSSLLGATETLEPGAAVVVELSSFMLEGMRELAESPHVAVVTNLSPNHLDRHGTLENYYGAKRAIVDFQETDDVAILNADDPEVSQWDAHTRARVIWVSVRREPEGDAAFVRNGWLVVRFCGKEEAVAKADMLRLPGSHNLANALMAASAALAAGAPVGCIEEVIATFDGLPHRLEMVAETPERVTFYNDSIATTPESVICALNSFAGPITLIAGGSSKKVSFDQLGEAVAQKVRRLILLGATAAKIEDAVARAEARLHRGPDIVHVTSLRDAVEEARRGAVPAETVLLSPACASFDMFRNFEERGDLFRALARKVAAR